MSVQSETSLVIRVLSKRLQNSIASNKFDESFDIIETMREEMIMAKLHKNLED